MCEGTPSSCCWAPAKPAPAGEYGRSASSSRLVVVGTDSGSLALWDLSEPTGQHQDVTLNQGEGLTLRRPSYMTDWRPEVNHGARVCAVKVQQSPGSDDRAAETNCRNGLESGLGAGLESASGPLAQVLSLDVTGWLHVWSAVPVTELDSAVIDTDFGLRLGSRVRLLRVAAVDCFSATSPGRELGFDAVSQTAVGFATVPGDPSQLLVATEGGSVVRASRFGLPPASLPHPHRFAFGNSDVSGRSPTSVLTSAGRKEAGVTCLQAEGDALLVGYADGTIALYSLQSKRAVREWREIIRGAVWGLRWCRGQSSLFVALDSRSVLYLFDVSGDGSKPVKSIDLGSGGKVWTGDARDGRFDLCGVGAEWMLAVVQETGVTVRRIVKL